MFGKKKDGEPPIKSDAVKVAGETGGSKNYMRAAQPATRPMVYPDFPKRQPEMHNSAFPLQTNMTPMERTRPSEENKKLIVGRDITLNGEIHTCDYLVVEGRVEAQIKECKVIEIMPSGEFKGSANVEQAEINGKFDGEITVNRRLIVRAKGRLSGKIRYRELEVERGAIIEGDIQALADSETAMPLFNEKENQ